MSTINAIALRKAKIVYNFGLPECNRVKASWSLCCVHSKKNTNYKDRGWGVGGRGGGGGGLAVKVNWYTLREATYFHLCLPLQWWSRLFVPLEIKGY